MGWPDVLWEEMSRFYPETPEFQWNLSKKNSICNSPCLITGFNRLKIPWNFRFPRDFPSFLQNQPLPFECPALEVVKSGHPAFISNSSLCHVTSHFLFLFNFQNLTNNWNSIFFRIPNKKKKFSNKTFFSLHLSIKFSNSKAINLTPNNKILFFTFSTHFPSP